MRYEPHANLFDGNVDQIQLESSIWWVPPIYCCKDRQSYLCSICVYFFLHLRRKKDPEFLCLLIRSASPLTFTIFKRSGIRKLSLYSCHQPDHLLLALQAKKIHQDYSFLRVLWSKLRGITLKHPHKHWRRMQNPQGNIGPR